MRYRTIVLALLTTGCAYHAPDAPTPPPPVSQSAPYYLTLGAAVGTGTQAGQATVTAKVQNVSGMPLAGVPVAFQTDLGTIAPIAATTGDTGVATTTITAGNSARVTATAGSLTTIMLVASMPPVPTPSPIPTPQPTPTPPMEPVSLTISAGSTVLGTSTIFAANVRNSSGTFNITWDYGDGLAGASTSPTTAHTYAATGTYNATAIIRDAGRTASATVTAVVTAKP